MHRKPVLDLLDRYLELHPDELVPVDHIRQFVRVHEDCFERTCIEGHITGSAWVVSPDHEAVLLTHHAKLHRWLQLGGHADGDFNPFLVALRETREESGMERFVEPSGAECPVPFDIDVHRIPERGKEPAHLHLDFRYLLVAEPGQTIAVSDESIELRWVALSEVPRLSDEESLLRMLRKTPALLREGAVRPAR